jgi:hypothetical protein
MDELVSVVSELKPDGFTPTIIKRGEDYLYVEYQSPTFGVRFAFLATRGVGYCVL